MPMVPRPGMGAMMRMPNAARLRANVVLEIFDLGNAHARSRHQLIQGHRRTDGCFDAGNLNAVVPKGVLDSLFVGFQLFMADLGLAGAVGRQQVNVGQFKPAQIQVGSYSPKA